MKLALYYTAKIAYRFWSSKATWGSQVSAKSKIKSCRSEFIGNKKPKVKLTDQQKQILEAISKGSSIFITGSAGTGKTYLLQHIISKLSKIHGKSRVFVTASTGVAACSLNGQTLHSFAGIGLGDASNVDLLSKVTLDKKAYRRWNKARALVIDEISMISGEVFDNLEFIARSIRSEELGCAEKIWGGIQLVVSGDFFQLPPVISNKGQQKEFAFEADCWNASFDMQIELKTIFRQSDAQLIKLLQGIRKGKYDSEDLKVLDQCCSNVEPDSSAVQLYPRIEDVNRVNAERLDYLDEVLFHYQALDSGKDPWKKQLKNGIAPELLKLCVGSRVLLTKNIDVISGLVNGATGTILDFVVVQETHKLYDREISDICGNGNLLPVVRFDSGQELMIGLERWYVMEGDQAVAMRKQIPLILAWALSIHKCQGMTLNNLHTDLYRVFGFGMVYVALSRVKSLDGLHLVNFNPSKIKANPKVLKFYERLSGEKDEQKEDGVTDEI
ncbi:ATP-dependent DNA helicase PIF1 [Capsicum galapagoense]